MSLFKRLLLSLFPENFGGTSGPAAMFLSLVNAKHFFTVITKRMVENPKLNLFDVGLDPVEVKIGFGEQATIKPKDIELYFSYCVCANLNGYKFYNPTNIASLASLAISQYFTIHFPKNKKGTDLFMTLLLTINIVSYVFAARIKIFPEKLSKNKLFTRFIELFFNYYKFIAGVYNIKLSKKTMQELKNQLLLHTDIFFGLYYMYRRINTLFDNGEIDSLEYYEWMFSDELKKQKKKAQFKQFQEDHSMYIYSSELSPLEDALLDALMPAEVLIKLFYNREDVFLMSESIIPKLFPQQTMDAYLHGFLKDDSGLDAWLMYILDHKRRKEGFFDNLKKMILIQFRNGSVENDIEELLSSISDGDVGIGNIPESLKQEGMMMDRVLNFYVGLMGSLRIGRGDSFYIRLLRPGLLNALLSQNGTAKRLSINYYSALLNQYSKNQFFYRVIFDGVRSGKSSFILPYVADVKEVYNNITILKHFDEMAVAVLMQDVLQKDIKLSLHQESIVSDFQELVGNRVSIWISFNTNTLLEVVYGPIDRLLNKPIVLESLLHHIQDQDIKNLKDTLYTLDFWIYHELVEQLRYLQLSSFYTDSVIFNILAIFKETLPGLLFLLHMVLNKQQEKKLDAQISQLLSLYITQVLNVAAEFTEQLLEIIHHLYDKHKNLIETWCKIDDNQYFLEVGVDCRVIFVSQEKKSEYHISAEDVLWFRGYLKHVTYYNKRYVMPKL